MASTENVDMTPAQCRAARALIGMTQPALAEMAGCSLSTVVDFEKDRRSVSSNVQIALMEALERSGVEFVPENGAGAGVRFKKKCGDDE